MEEIVSGSEKGCQNMCWGEFKYFQSGNSLIYALKSLTSILPLSYSERYTSNNIPDARREKERETPAPPNLLQIPLWIEFISFVHNISCLVITKEIVLGSEKGCQNMCWGEFNYFQSGNSLIYALKSLTSILPLSYSERDILKLLSKLFSLENSLSTFKAVITTNTTSGYDLLPFCKLA
ncbi:hypothetical protein CDAR_67631 [Caerostris darwini]|uniref:Uncharacterized protein n=1 Tax=Caerostris darwini TaxID=1538125 RepID=A0AAV4V6S8_9ARAC|nr:hypothetical protein CDAR_67631 [Caerostris darwini]